MNTNSSRYHPCLASRILDRSLTVPFCKCDLFCDCQSASQCLHQRLKLVSCALWLRPTHSADDDNHQNRQLSLKYLHCSPASRAVLAANVRSATTSVLTPGSTVVLSFGVPS